MRILIGLLVFFPAISFAITWDQVRISNQVDKSACEYISQETCNTRRSNGNARCIKWHKKRAAKRGTNNIVFLTADSDKRLTTINNQLITMGTTTVLAGYYMCP